MLVLKSFLCLSPTVHTVFYFPEMLSLKYATSKQFMLRQSIKNKLQDVVTVPKATNFYEAHRKGKYRREPPPLRERVIKGLKQLPEESKKFIEETKYNLRVNNLIFPEHGDYEIFYRFNDSKSIKKWVVTCDSTHNEGKSYAEFILSPHEKGVFKGVLNTELPKDGIITKAGYANIKVPRNMVRFNLFTYTVYSSSFWP